MACPELRGEALALVAKLRVAQQLRSVDDPLAAGPHGVGSATGVVVVESGAGVRGAGRERQSRGQRDGQQAFRTTRCDAADVGERTDAGGRERAHRHADQPIAIRDVEQCQRPFDRAATDAIATLDAGGAFRLGVVTEELVCRRIGVVHAGLRAVGQCVLVFRDIGEELILLAGAEHRTKLRQECGRGWEGEIRTRRIRKRGCPRNRAAIVHEVSRDVHGLEAVTELQPPVDQAICVLDVTKRGVVGAGPVEEQTEHVVEVHRGPGGGVLQPPSDTADRCFVALVPATDFELVAGQVECGLHIRAVALRAILRLPKVDRVGAPRGAVARRCPVTRTAIRVQVGLYFDSCLLGQLEAALQVGQVIATGPLCGVEVRLVRRGTAGRGKGLRPVRVLIPIATAAAKALQRQIGIVVLGAIGEAVIRHHTMRTVEVLRLDVELVLPRLPHAEESTA